MCTILLPTLVSFEMDYLSLIIKSFENEIEVMDSGWLGDVIIAQPTFLL